MFKHDKLQQPNCRLTAPPRGLGTPAYELSYSRKESLTQASNCLATNQTDGRHAIARTRFATIVHRTVKIHIIISPHCHLTNHICHKLQCRK